MSFFDKLSKMFAPPEAQINEAGFYAVEEHKISGKKVKEWSDMLREGKLPSDLTIVEYFEWNDRLEVYHEFRWKPIEGVTSVEYEDITIARFDDGKWILCAPSSLEGIPPITSKEIPAIGGKKSITD